jgi:hypothetical protein
MQNSESFFSTSGLHDLDPLALPVFKCGSKNPHLRFGSANQQHAEVEVSEPMLGCLQLRQRAIPPR